MRYSCSGEIATSLRITPYGSYKFFHNSKLNKRGVGVIIETSASISVLKQWRDGHDNILGLQLEREGKKFYLIAVYGPNHVQANFFHDLRTCIDFLGELPLVMGGDWNCTYSTSPPATNIDIFKMTNAPNLNHSKLLKKLCDDFELCDPFRTKFPNRLEFTYLPSNALRQNRSRIDFFIISCSLYNSVTEIANKSSLQNKLFDHMAIRMSFVPKLKAPTPPTISKLILEDPDLDRIVTLAVADTYLIHSSLLAENVRVGFQHQLGLAKGTLRACGPDSAHLPPGLRSELDENIRAANIATVDETIDSIPLAALQREELRDGTPPDIFMEALVNNIRNEVNSHQIYIKKQINKTVDQMEKDLSNLKKNFHTNSDQINALESALNTLTDKILRKKLESCANFEILNNEKITPHFVNIAKGFKSEASLDDILDADGRAFPSTDTRKEFIRSYYQELYATPEDKPESLEGCIEEFLGQDILKSNLVRDSIIPPDLREELEKQFTIEELDASAHQGNRSASGMDGLSNCFIKRFRHLLRTPLFRYSKFCIDNSRLSNSFKTACIKLIPKKGDTKQLKNWRPISLLSCLYKVLSRALNNRLKKIREHIFSRGQKGFTNGRYIQEVLINVIEMIAHCRYNNIPGVIVSIDQAKAFDTVSHKFMHEVYKFFGLGPNFIQALETLGNNRTTGIAFEDGTHSRPVKLGRGRAQGNTSSPIEYNMAEQIVIFKMELCPEIASVYLNHTIARPYLYLPENVEPLLPLEADATF